MKQPTNTTRYSVKGYRGSGAPTVMPRRYFSDLGKAYEEARTQANTLKDGWVQVEQYDFKTVLRVYKAEAA